MIPRAHVRPVLAIVLFVLSSLSFQSECSAQKNLAWKFSRNRVIDVLIEQDTSMQLEVGGVAKQPANPTLTNQITSITWTVKELDADGVATVEQMINRVQLDVKSTVGNFLIDTANNQPLQGLGETMAKGIRPLAGARFLVATKPTGEISDVSIPPDLTGKLKDGAGGLGEAALREIVRNGSLQFPNKPIVVGDTWSSQYELDIQAFGKLLVTTTYQYLGEEKAGGGVLDKIKATTAVKASDTSDSSGLKLKGQESSGMVWFDNVRGCIDHSEFKQDMAMDVKNNGLEVTQAIKQTMKLKFIPRS